MKLLTRSIIHVCYYLGLKGAFEDRSQSRNHNFNTRVCDHSYCTFVLEKFELLRHLSDSNKKLSITVIHTCINMVIMDSAQSSSNKC